MLTMTVLPLCFLFLADLFAAVQHHVVGAALANKRLRLVLTRGVGASELRPLIHATT